MPIPQVNDRIKEAPAVMLRAVFAGVGQLLLAADKVRSRAADSGWPAVPKSHVRGQVHGPARGNSRWHAPGQVRGETVPLARDRAAAARPAATAATGPVGVSTEAAAAPAEAAIPTMAATAAPAEAAAPTEAAAPGGAAPAGGSLRGPQTGPGVNPEIVRPNPAKKVTKANGAGKAPAAAKARSAGKTKATGKADSKPDGKTAGKSNGKAADGPKPAAKAKAKPAAPPVPGYDDLTLPSLRARMRGFDMATLRAVLAYEKAHAQRDDVIIMFERRLAKVAAE